MSSIQPRSGRVYGTAAVPSLTQSKTLTGRYVETGMGSLSYNGMIRSIVILSGTLLCVALVPFFGAALLVLGPLPILYFYLRLGRIRGVAAVIASSVLASVILVLLGHRPNVAVVATIAYSGIMMAEVLKKNYSLSKSVMTAAIALFVIMIAFIAYGAFGSGMTPWQLVENHVSSLIRENIKIYAQLNISDDQIRLIGDNAAEIAVFFTGIFPALLLSGAVITVCLNVLSARLLLRRIGILFPDLGDLTLWKAPEKLVWVLIAAGGMLLSPLDLLNTIGMNIMIISCLLYLFQGLAIAAFFFRRKGVPRSSGGCSTS